VNGTIIPEAIIDNFGCFGVIIARDRHRKRAPEAIIDNFGCFGYQL